jgi:hypothetical protein
MPGSFFLHQPSELASRALLSGIGVEVVHEVVSCTESSHCYVSPPSEDWSPEYYALAEEELHNSSGVTAYLDVRDSAEEWVRLSLAPGETVLVRGAPGAESAAKSGKVDPPLGLALYRRVSGGLTSSQLRIPRLVVPSIGLGRAAEIRALVCSLCAQFYPQGWFSGTGGSFCIRLGERVYIAPSAVQKERIQAEVRLFDR